jgi:hypothetical protein
MREAANGLGRADEDVIRVSRIDDDPVDPAPQEGVARVRASVSRVADAGIGELRPGVAAVRGLVNTDARFAAR